MHFLNLRGLCPHLITEVTILSEDLSFVDACTEDHFRAMSLIHALGWRDTYRGYVPDEYMAREITDERWVGQFRTDYETGRCHGLLLYREDTPVACINYGPGQDRKPQRRAALCVPQRRLSGLGGDCLLLHSSGRAGPGIRRDVFDEVVRRLRTLGFSKQFVFVLRENEKARRFYARHGFSWDGTHAEIPFPPDAVCVDLRYVRTF